MKNKILLEANIEKHFMTKEERLLRKKLVELLVKNHHVKYAKRLALFDINIVPLNVKGGKDFTAAISFDEGVIFISEGFLQDEAIFFQLDVLMRHELAHNLMMHQIRMMHVFRDIYAKDDPDEAYAQIKSSASLHTILNWIEDFEISNKRYSDADKKIARQLELNGRVINGLVTEDHRDSWMDMSLEDMYTQLSTELENVNDAIRNDPNWQPIKAGTFNEVDGLALQGAKMIARYYDPDSYSSLGAYTENGISLEDIDQDKGDFKKLPEQFKKIAKLYYNAFKDFTSDPQIEEVKKVLKAIAATKPEESIVIYHPDTGDKIGTLYTADYKGLVSDILKKIIEKPIQLSQDFVDAWTQVMNIVGPQGLSNDELDVLINAITNNASFGIQ